MRTDQGFTLMETLVVLALTATIVGVSAAYSIPAIARSKMRSAIHDVQSFMQLARIEAISRSRECRFVLNTTDGLLEVWDGSGTSSPDDDILLRSSKLPRSVVVARPDTGLPISLERIGASTSYETVFLSDGVVGHGAGSLFLHGGYRYVNISVYAAGGMELKQWVGTAWESL
jgi:prepilin-type N-terminal cleavage/methylation domain-containing protein